jgi:hypothetical protein
VKTFEDRSDAAKDLTEEYENPIRQARQENGQRHASLQVGARVGERKLAVSDEDEVLGGRGVLWKCPVPGCAENLDPETADPAGLVAAERA